MMSKSTWSNLFPEILVEIVSYLGLEDHFCISTVCKSWQEVVKTTQVMWQKLCVMIIAKSVEEEERDIKRGVNKKDFISFICDHCHLANRFSLTVSQTSLDCAQTALYVLRQLSMVKCRRLRNFQLIFADKNPLFYSGKDFLEILDQLFHCPKEDCNMHEHLTTIDLSKFPVCLNNQLVCTLAGCHGNSLSDVNLQNCSLVCNISKECIHNFARICRNLVSFSIHMSCFDGETLQIFGESSREPLKILSFFCQREDKYTSDIEAKDWLCLCKACPNLQVIMHFDHTCPIFKVEEILKPVIPITVLKLRLLATVTDLIYVVANSYSKTLEVFDVTTTSSIELDAAILYLAMNCGKLKELHVWCRLSKSVVDSILFHQKFERYTLAYNLDCEV